MDVAIYIIGGIVILGTFLQLWPHKHWVFRVPEYLCRQLAWLGVLSFLLSFLLVSSSLRLGFQVALLCAVVYLVYKIYPYTRWGGRDVPDTPSDQEERISLSVLMINVYQYNKFYERTLDLITEVDADIVLIVEGDANWKHQLTPSFERYKEQILLDRDDTYGMFLLSKYDIIREEVRTVYDETPSIRCSLNVHGHMVRLFGLHPKPPSPTEAATSEPKDAELEYVSSEIAAWNSDSAVLVVGDINDVAWSNSTLSFLAKSGLRDPRKGRGTIVTFPAYAPFMGFPLDQVFCSKHFTVDTIKRLRHVGSDHFPLFTSLSFAKSSPL